MRGFTVHMIYKVNINQGYYTHTHFVKNIKNGALLIFKSKPKRCHSKQSNYKRKNTLASYEEHC